MDRKKRSILYEKESEIREMIEKGYSPTMIFQEFNLAYSGNYTTFRRVCEELGIPKPKKYIGRKERTSPLTQAEMFCEKSKTARNNLKAQYLKLVEYSCCDCGNKGFYNGKALSLQLHHVNGVRDDNRMENLQLLCPNCHTQTDSFAGKSLRKEKPIKVKVVREYKKYFTWPSKEELERLYSEKTAGEIAKIYGCSDRTVGVWCKKYGIETRGRGGRI